MATDSGGGGSDADANASVACCVSRVVRCALCCALITWLLTWMGVQHAWQYRGVNNNKHFGNMAGCTTHTCFHLLPDVARCALC
eukprot:8690838-Lingulodinium_polyedra.AAC.1